MPPALPIVRRSPRLAEAVGLTRSHKPSSAIPLDTQVWTPKRRKYSGTNTTYKTVIKAEFDAVV